MFEEKRIGTQGWKQFLDNKISMLYKFNSARTFSKAQIVEVAHGNVAESEFRKWLSEFLPYKYGVSSGYIVSQSREFIHQEKLPHYDVIIYDRLNSPTLWVEDNSDKSEHGRTRAFPAEYIKAVFEVKSRLTSKTAKDSMDKLEELNCLILNSGDINDRFCGKIMPSFFCGSVFFEIKKEDEFDKNILNNLIPSNKIHNFYGGIILSAEGKDAADTGIIRVTTSDKDIESYKESLILGMPFSDFKKVSDDKYLGTVLMWGMSEFSIFAFNILVVCNF